MGRKMRRQEERKNRNRSNLKQEEITTDISGSTIIKVIIAVVLILLVLYYILAVFVTKEIDVSGKNANANNTTTNASSGVANKILANAIFNQKEESYYVYFYDFTDEDESIGSVIGTVSDYKIYRVDTNSSLNSKYVTEEVGNHNVDDISNLLVKNPTLLVITNDQVTGYYEGRDSIISFLNS